MVGDWATHAWFFPVYLLGFAIMLEPRLEEAIGRAWRTALFPAVLTSSGLALFAWPGDVYARIPADPSVWHIVFWPIAIQAKFLLILGLSFAGPVLVLEGVGRIGPSGGLFGLREKPSGGEPRTPGGAETRLTVVARLLSEASRWLRGVGDGYGGLRCGRSGRSEHHGR
jgi:hypothetical protein